MKIRNGFVSNSSSSSYIIAIKDLFEACPTCGRTGNDLLKMLRNDPDMNDDNGVKGVGAEHILWEMNNDEWYNPKEELVNKVKSYQNKKGWTLASIDISYHNEIAKDELTSLLKSGNVVILDGPDWWVENYPTEEVTK